MLRLLLPLCLAISAHSADVPQWALSGILATETRSHFRADGSICYVDQRRGAHGELSSFQITSAAFRQVRRHGEQFWMIETDQRFAEQVAVRYLLWLYDRSGSWDAAVMAYNAGLGHAAPRYLSAVKAAGGGL